MTVEELRLHLTSLVLLGYENAQVRVCIEDGQDMVSLIDNHNIHDCGPFTPGPYGREEFVDLSIGPREPA